MAEVSKEEIEKALKDVKDGSGFALAYKEGDTLKIQGLTNEEFAELKKKLAEGQGALPEGAKVVQLNEKKEIVGEPRAATKEALGLIDQKESELRQQIAAAFGTHPEYAGKAALMILGADGKPTDKPIKVFNTEDELAEFLKNGGQGITLGEGERVVLARYGKGEEGKEQEKGKVTVENLAPQTKPGPDGYKEYIASLQKTLDDAEKEAKSQKNGNWFETFMHQALSSGNLAFMLIAALFARALSGGGRDDASPSGRAGRGATTRLAAQLKEMGVAHNPEGAEVFSVPAGSATNDVAKTLAHELGITNVEGLAAAMQAGESVAGDKKTFTVDIDKFLSTPQTPSAPGAERPRGPDDFNLVVR